MSYEKKRNIVFFLTFFFSGIYLLWRVFFTLPFSAGTGQVAFGILLVTAEVITTLTSFELMVNKMKSKKTELELPSILEEDYPHVDIFIATHNEPADLLYKTINACTFFEYPDKEKVHIYVCDDGDRKEIAELAHHLSVHYLGLSGNKHAKSGNLNNALSKTSSPLIVTFDADMIPQRSFLMKTVPYFLLSKYKKEEDGTYRKLGEDEVDTTWKLGLIQTPQSFYNHDLFQFNLFSESRVPNEQDFFSREINVMRNSTNSTAYTGSNTVILRKAMEEIGGFPYKTITEDFETSLRLQKAGYITYSTSEILAAGLSTTTVKSMIKQRIRWAQGVIQSIQNTNAIFTRDLPLSGRISYLNAYLYWWSFFTRMIFIVAPILFALFDFQLVECSFFELLIFWLPSHMLYSISMRYLSTNIRTLRWSQIIDTILAPYLIIPVFLESIGIHERTFKVTNKKKVSIKTTSYPYIIPHGILIVLSVLALARYLNGKYGMALIYSSVITFWLSYNLIALIYAVFFMLGRSSYRKYERIKAKEKVELQVEDEIYQGETVDVSEEGIAFVLKEELYLEAIEKLTLSIQTKYYHTTLNGNIVYRKQVENGWYYAAQIKPIDEENKRQYLQVIHDRIHSLPKEIDPWNTAYDDIYRNIRHRVAQRKSKRK